MSLLTIARNVDDLTKWRPSYVVGHIEQPIYDARTTYITYAKVTASLPRVIRGVWILKDVHIVDISVAELMARIKHHWHRGQMHLVLLSPTAKAAMQWATYIGCDKPSIVPSLSAFQTRSRMVANVPNTSIVQLSNWIQMQKLQGDILVFAQSAQHRDALCDAWTCCHLQVPVHKVELRLPHPKGGPRVLVGTPNLDYMLDAVHTQRIQHVIDFGKVYRLRQDTGMDWEKTFISQSMADGRTAAAQSQASGLCLRVYAADNSLSTEALFAHKLSHDQCKAHLMIRCGHSAMDRFPIALPNDTMPLPVATLMVRLHVEKPIATILHATPSLDLGIGIAAILYRHSAPYVKYHYEACTQDTMPANVLSCIHTWADILGRSPRKILRTVRQATWDQVQPFVFQGYPRTIAVAVGNRKEYIDIRTGDILHCRYNFCPRDDAIVYTRRQDYTIVSYLPIPLSWVTTTLQHTRVHSPVRLEKDIAVLAMQTWFETKQVVAWPVSPTEVEITCGNQVNLSEVVAEWTDTMRHKALNTPLVVRLDNGSRIVSTRQNMSMIFTAGLRFSDALTTSDFIVMHCDANTLTTQDLLLLHKIPGLWIDDATMILGTRQEAESLWDRIENISVRALAFDYQRFQPCQVLLRLVVKVYRGKSTGRAAVVQSCQDKAWISKVDPAWQWEIHENVDLVSLYPSQSSQVTTLCNIPEHMDEIDIATLLEIDPSHVTLERTVDLLAHLPCVTRFFRAVDPNRTILSTRTSRYTEVYMKLDQSQMHHALRMVYDLLPTTNDIVNQPLRAHWTMVTTTGSHPSTLLPRTPTITIVDIKRHDFDHEWIAVSNAFESATRLAMHNTPTLTWCAKLAVPWIDVNLPRVESSGGPLFRLYGSDEDKTESRQALHQLAEETPDPAPDKYDACPICLDPMASYALAICGCRFCPPCLVQALEIKCTDETFGGELQCPVPTCQERVSTQDLSLLLRPEILRIFATRIAKRLSPRIPDIIRECPGKCGFFGRLRATRPPQPFVCQHCDTSWCTTCSDKVGTAVASHLGGCDKQWDPTYWRNFEKEATLAGARACPQCGTYVAKDGGCNHVRCMTPNCQAHFCWKCLQTFSHVPLSLPAQGVVQSMEEDLVTILVDKDTWKTPCHAPAPQHIVYRTAHARSMLVNQDEELKPKARVWVYSYVYDHLDACAHPA